MLFELYEIPFEAQAIYPVFGVILGIAFGVLALLTGFCLRSALVGKTTDRFAAKSVWATVFITAVLGSVTFQHLGLIDQTDHRLFTTEIPILALLIGGGIFGSGMVLARGCVARTTILLATGNLRSLFVLLIFAITAYATLKGILDPLRILIRSVHLDLGIISLADLPGGAYLWAIALSAVVALWVAPHFPSRAKLIKAVGLGLLVPIAWAGTSIILNDPFEPQPAQSFSFTLPWIELLFSRTTSNLAFAGEGFRLGMIAGVLFGSFLTAWQTGKMQLRGFETPNQIPRYLLGAIFMGFGSVLAGGCSVSVGLSGASSLSVAALVGLMAMIIGALVTSKILERGLGNPAPASVCP